MINQGSSKILISGKDLIKPKYNTNDYWGPIKLKCYTNDEPRWWTALFASLNLSSLSWKSEWHSFKNRLGSAGRIVNQWSSQSEPAIRSNVQSTQIDPINFSSWTGELDMSTRLVQRKIVISKKNKSKTRSTTSTRGIQTYHEDAYASLLWCSKTNIYNIFHILY